MKDGEAWQVRPIKKDLKKEMFMCSPTDGGAESLQNSLRATSETHGAAVAVS